MLLLRCIKFCFCNKDAIQSVCRTIYLGQFQSENVPIQKWTKQSFREYLLFTLLLKCTTSLFYTPRIRNNIYLVIHVLNCIILSVTVYQGQKEIKEFSIDHIYLFLELILFSSLSAGIKYCIHICNKWISLQLS